MPGRKRLTLSAEGCDALRSFMHRKEAADAMPGAVRIIDAVGPQELPRQGIELPAGGALGKADGGKRDMALEHLGKPALHLSGRGADGDRAGHIGGAVEVLPA